MITPDYLLDLWNAHREALETPIRTFSFETHGRTFEDRAYQMGVVNLSRDSSYRESIAATIDGALYRAKRMTLEGCAMIDVGAESTGDDADVVNVDRQLASLLPVVRAYTEAGILTSVETYHTAVAQAALAEGAKVINLTGRIDDPAFYDAVAQAGAGLILCYTPGETARSKDALPPADTLIAEQMAYFKERIAMATDAGVSRIWVDPGFGFALNLPDGPARVRYQTESMLNGFRLRVLGWPICLTLTSSVYHFRDEVRCGETASAVLALLGKGNLLRSHEGARVQPVIDTIDICKANA